MTSKRTRQTTVKQCRHQQRLHPQFCHLSRPRFDQKLCELICYLNNTFGVLNIEKSSLVVLYKFTSTLCFVSTHNSSVFNSKFYNLDTQVFNDNSVDSACFYLFGRTQRKGCVVSGWLLHRNRQCQKRTLSSVGTGIGRDREEGREEGTSHKHQK